MTIIKIKLLTNSFLLYRIGKKLYRYKTNLDYSQNLLPLTDNKLIKLSNNYQKLTKKWVRVEKRVLLLRGFLRLKNNHNL